MKISQNLCCFCIFLFIAACVQIVSAETGYQNNTTFWGGQGSGGGLFSYPLDIAVDGAGTVFVADYGNNLVQKFDPDGGFLGQWDPHVDGGFAMDVDDAGNVYVLDSGYHIRRFTSNGLCTAEWGAHNYSYTSPGVFILATDIAVDNSGHVYVLDTSGHSVQKFSSDGLFLGWWGDTVYPYYDNSPPVPFDNCINKIAADDSGHVYVTDSSNRVYRFTASGTYAGIAVSIGPNSQGIPRIDYLTIDSAGNIYTILSPLGQADNPFRKYDASGRLVQEWGSHSLSSDMMVFPTGIAVNSSGYVYVSDGQPGCVWRFSPQNGEHSVDVISPNTANIGGPDIWIHLLGPNFPRGTTFKLTNATLGNISVKEDGTRNFIYILSDIEIAGGGFSFTNATAGLYDVEVTYPDGTTDTLENGFRVVPVPVVLVHGWNSNGATWEPLERALEAEGIPYWNFEYDARTDPRLQAQNLSDFIRERGSTYMTDVYKSQGYYWQGGKVDIVCHSMGSIVSRYYLEYGTSGGYWRPMVRQWIGIAPAHGGSGAADWLFDSLWDWVGNKAVRDKGESTLHLRTASDTVQNLKSNQLSRWTTYRVIAGWNPRHDHDFGNLVWFWRNQYMTREATADRGIVKTYRGDGLIAQNHSFREGMGFECFPILGDPEGGNNEPAVDFDHTHIHRSPAVINRVIKYLENPDLPKNVSFQEEPVPTPLLQVVTAKVKALWGWISLGTTITQFVIVQSATVDEPSRSDAALSSYAETATIDELYFNLDWAEGNLSLELTAPDGRVLTSEADTATSWTIRDTNRLFMTVASPPGGNWSTRIIPVSLPDHPVQFNLTVYSSGTGAGVPQGQVPVSSFMYSAIPAVVNRPVQFTDTSTNHPTEWQWIIDNTSYSIQNPAHTFSSSGPKNVRLIASNDAGTGTATSVQITVADGPTTPTQTTAVAIVPGGSGTPTGIGTGGMYDDVNGNGRKDFADVVLYFNQMTWIADREPVSAFDYNGNGRIDFADVVWLFNHL